MLVALVVDVQDQDIPKWNPVIGPPGPKPPPVSTNAQRATPQQRRRDRATKSVRTDELIGNYRR